MALADLEMFSDASPAELARIEPFLAPRRVDPGGVVMREGEPGTCFMVMLEGDAVVTREGVEVGRVGAGSIVGELALLHGTERTATVTAASQVFGLEGDADAFAEIASITGVRERFGRAAAQRLGATAAPVMTALRDGTPVAIRVVLPSDRSALEAALDEHFSPQSLQRRFFTGGRPAPALISYLVDVDYVNHFAWVALAPEDGDRGIASARWIRLGADSRIAEIGLGVADDYHGRGLGTLLLGALGAAAPVAAIETFRANVLADNAPMRAILERVGASWSRVEPGVVCSTVAVDAVAGFADRDLGAALRDAAGDILAAANLALA